jgi:hypothetical membrane protein
MRSVYSCGRVAITSDVTIMEDRLASVLVPPRNVWAVAALWIVVLSWIALAARVALSDVGSVSNPLDWLYFGAVCSGVLVSTAGLVAIRRRGEASLAVGVFALSLALPILYVLFFGFLWLLLGSSGGAVD